MIADVDRSIVVVISQYSESWGFIFAVGYCVAVIISFISIRVIFGGIRVIDICNSVAVTVSMRAWVIIIGAVRITFIGYPICISIA